MQANNNNKNKSEFRSPDKETIATAAAKKASEFSKLCNGEQYILEMGFRFGAEFMINYNKKQNLNSL